MDLSMFLFTIVFSAFLASAFYLTLLQEIHKVSKGIPVECESVEEIYEILAEKLKCSFLKEIRINEKQKIEFQCEYDTHIGILEDGKFYIDKLARKFSSHREVEEAWYLQKFVEGVFSSEHVEGEVLEQRFAKYIKIFNVSRVIKYAVIVCVVILIFSKLGGRDTIRSKGVSQMYFTEYSDEITIGEALKSAFTKGKWSNDKIRDDLYHVTYSGYGANGSLLTILFQTDGKKCSIKSIMMDGEDITLGEGLFLETLYESVKNGGGDGKDINTMDNQDDELSETSITSNDGKYRIGETIQLYSEGDTGQTVSVTLTKWGQLFGTEDGNLIYVNYTIENTGTSNIIVGDSLFDIYADNNKAEMVDGENSIWSEEISSGREARGTLYAKIVPKEYTSIEVECGGCVYLLWDASFVKPLLGSYSWEKGDAGANITLKTAKAYGGYSYLIIEGECWKGDDYGEFRTGDQLSFNIAADASKDTRSIEFHDIESNKLIISPTAEGLYVEQSGEILSKFTYSWTNELSFSGTYSKGTVEKPKFDERNLESSGNSTIDEEFYDNEVQGAMDDSISAWELSGYYGGITDGQSVMDISMYTEDTENGSIGYANIYVEGGEYSYQAELYEISTNLYWVETDTDEEVALSAYRDGTNIVVQLYVDGECITEYLLMGQFQS